MLLCCFAPQVVFLLAWICGGELGGWRYHCRMKKCVMHFWDAVEMKQIKNKKIMETQQIFTDLFFWQILYLTKETKTSCWSVLPLCDSSPKYQWLSIFFHSSQSFVSTYLSLLVVFICSSRLTFIARLWKSPLVMPAARSISVYL